MPSSDSHNDAAPDFAEEFAAYSATLKLDRLPASAVDAAKLNLFDTLACAIAGISASGVAELAGLVSEWGGKSEASIWCSSSRVPAHHAALVNGMMAHAHDYDDTHDAAVLHAGVSVIPAALAAAERNRTASGADLIAGIVAGLELNCRLGMATTISLIDSGFIYTSLFGYFGATVAAARVSGLNHEQTANALGIAYSQVAGTHQVTRDAALTKRIQPGFAAKAALVSVAMAQIGIRGTRNTFEGIDGLFRTYLRGQYDRAILREALGIRFECANLSYKPYPCCRFNHAAIDAALELRRQLGQDVATIKRVLCKVSAQAYEVVCQPASAKAAPQNVVQAQFSLPYTVACALVHGRVGLSQFTESALANSHVRAIAQRIETGVDSAIERQWSRGVSPADLIVETEQGSTRVRVDLPRGHPQSPMARDDFDSKLADCLSTSGLRWPEETPARIRSSIDNLENSAVAADVVLPLLNSK